MPRMLALAMTLSLLSSGAWADAASDSAAPAESASQPPAVSRQPAPRRSELDAQALRAAWPQQAQRLEALGEPFLALWSPARTGTAKGVVILLPGQGESADWPRVIAPLRQRLPDYGWHTLSLTPPEPSVDPALRAREVAPEQSKPVDASPVTPEPPDAAKPNETADSEPPKTEPVEQATGAEAAQPAPSPASSAPATPAPTEAEQVAARLQAALTFIEQHDPASIVLIGHGTGAYWAAQFVTTAEATKIAGLALIEPRPSAAGATLESFIAISERPVLDLYYRSERSDLTAKGRRDEARRDSHMAYTQLALRPGAHDAEQLFRRVRGWLERSF